MNKLKQYKPFHKLSEAEKGHYMAGLLEGDGYLGSGKASIAFNRENRVVAENLCFYFRDTIYGRTEERSTKCELNISGNGLRERIRLINGQLVGNDKVKQLKT